MKDGGDALILVVVLVGGALLAWYLLASDTATAPPPAATTKGCAPVNVKGVPICTNLEVYKAGAKALSTVGVKVATAANQAVGKIPGVKGVTTAVGNAIGSAGALLSGSNTLGTPLDKQSCDSIKSQCRSGSGGNMYYNLRTHAPDPYCVEMHKRPCP